MKLTQSPPNDTPLDIVPAFTMNRAVPAYRMYFDNTQSNGVHNSAAEYERAFALLDAGCFKYYGHEVFSFYDALDAYPVAGKNVLAWGLAGCNCETMAVWKGADSVWVVEYKAPAC